MHSLRLVCWGHHPWGAPVAPQQLEPGGEQAAGRQKHSRLGKHLFRSHLLPRRAEVASSPSPGASWAAPTPACRLLSPSFATDGRSRQAAQRLPKTVSPSWSHTPWATYCTGSREARRSTAPPRPPGSPQPHEARPEQSRRSLGRKQSMGAGAGDRPRVEASQRQMRFKKA